MREILLEIRCRCSNELSPTLVLVVDRGLSVKRFGVFDRVDQMGAIW
jgi:hypothetical protein